MIFSKVRNIIAEQLDLDKKDINENTSFRELKIDSLELFQIIIDVEEEFDIQIESEDTIETVKDLMRIVIEKINIKKQEV